MPDRWRHEILAFVTVGIGGGLLVSPGARAADWSLSPGISFGGDYDTNRTLSITPRGSAGALGNVQVVMDRSTERMSLSLTPQLGFQWFSDPQLQRATSYGVAGAATWIEDRSQLALKTSFSDQSLINVELMDTGVVNVNTRRLGGEADLDWTLAQSERRTLTLDAAFQDIDYQGNTLQNLTEALQSSRYETLGANQGFIRSARLELDLGGSVGNFTSPAQPGSTRSYSLDVGFKTKPLERLSINADVGVNELLYAGTQTRGFIYDLSLSYANTRSTVSLTAQRNASPSGFGELTERDVVQLSVARGLSDRLSLTGALDFNRTSIAVGPFPIDNRTYADASLSLAYRLTETWTLSGRLLVDGAQTQGRFEALGLVGSARGLNAGVQAGWSPRRSSVSR